MNFVKLLGLNCVMAQEDQNSYNILAMDGGAIRGIITAACIDKIEQYAYTHAIAEDL
jgi:patatin-like phospholipase/acyl hydrolase